MKKNLNDSIQDSRFDFDFILNRCKMEVERTPLPGPPWVHLRTSGRNALDGTISKRFNLFICAVKKGKRNEPGTMTAIDLRDQTK